MEKAGLPGEVFVWHDVLYEGPRKPGWPTERTFAERAAWLCEITGGGLNESLVTETLEKQYLKLASAGSYDSVVLWFDACLFDQSMLCHILNCLRLKSITQVELLCVDAFPGIDPYNGLGQMTPEQLASVYKDRVPVTAEQYTFAKQVDDAFATQDMDAFTMLTLINDAPIRWVPAAVRRWLREQPDPDTGLGFLETLALDAIRSGCSKPGAIFVAVAKADEPPQYWGDTTLWAKVNALADRGLVTIEGPANRLPQWVSDLKLDAFLLAPQ